MHVLVTGGAGYLGCHLVPALLERGHQVRLFDRFAFGEDSIESFVGSTDCDVVHGDMRRLQDCPGLLDNIDAIAHLAGIANDPSCDLERDPMQKLTAQNQLSVYKHTDFWHCMDTYRDNMQLNKMWQNNPPWKIL